ncbi:hypothetical protein [Streptomyces malaysiensis]|uniref:hypothetical protein n=1 Tax=Streptomyces malaysiensis TaxID=92644 RepID=UPI000BFF296E|nr:hypothetical protein [Streptomyces malaysiensis]ATL81385.1 hypothetical protein SMALA_1150 [Streptomyces malaysiensis]
MPPGFGDVRTTPFCTFPDWLVTGAGAAGTNADHLARLVDLDRDRTAYDPTVSGQVFLLSAHRRPPTGAFGVRSGP